MTDTLKKILVADDNISVRVVLAGRIRKLADKFGALEVIEAQDGRQAVIFAMTYQLDAVFLRHRHIFIGLQNLQLIEPPG